MGLCASVPSDFVANKKLVIIGGGYAGHGMAKIADKHFDVTLIERREQLVHKIGGPRACVTKEWADLIIVPQEKLLKRGKRITASVIRVDKVLNQVILDNGDSIPYDYLVVATGGMTTGPCEPPATALTTVAMKHHYADVADKIAASSKVLIIGGGPVGCELSGEIASKYPGKKVTIVTKSARLSELSGMITPDTFHNKLQAKIVSKGVTVILNDAANISIDEFKGKSYLEGKRNVTLASGAVVDGVDLVLLCIGYKPSTQFINNDPTWEHEIEEETGLIMVDEYLNIQGMKTVFAIGDCNNVKEVKLGATAGTNRGKPPGMPRGQADYVLDFLYAAECGGICPPYKSAITKPMLIIPLGPKDAACLGVPGFFGSMKAKHYFYMVQWGSANQKAPAMVKS